jgi:hypothetical protein
LFILETIMLPLRCPEVRTPCSTRAACLKKSPKKLISPIPRLYIAASRCRAAVQPSQSAVLPPLHPASPPTPVRRRRPPFPVATSSPAERRNSPREVRCQPPHRLQLPPDPATGASPSASKLQRVLDECSNASVPAVLVTISFTTPRPCG